MPTSGPSGHASPNPAGAGAGKLLIVDGHCYAYRAFFAIRSLNSPTGQATNAIYGFIRMLGKVMAQIHPTHLIVVWDGGLAQERMTLHPEYKAHRPEMPSDLESQLDEIVSYLRAANVYSYLKGGCEADDCIAGITRRAVEIGWEVVIATSDKDFMQLVSKEVTLLNPSDKTAALMGVEEVKAKTGVEPTQIVDWLSLVGDAVDNIPGAPGIGPKTAADLLRQFGSIDKLYEGLNRVSERVKSTLEKAKDAVMRNQKLVKLDAESGCEVALEDLGVREVNVGKLRELYLKWGFKKLWHELEASHAQAADLFAENAGVS